MAFATTIEKVPANTTQGIGAGLSISIVKALAHASLIRATDDKEYLALPIKEEIKAIAEHLSKQNLLKPPYCTKAVETTIETLWTASVELLKEYDDWDEAKTKENLSLLIDRGLTLCLQIDKELGGITSAATGDHL